MIFSGLVDSLCKGDGTDEVLIDKCNDKMYLANMKTHNNNNKTKVLHALPSSWAALGVSLCGKALGSEGEEDGEA